MARVNHAKRILLSCMAVVLAVASAAILPTQASAANLPPPNGFVDRDRQGISNWAPQNIGIGVQAGIDPQAATQITVLFRWDDRLHMHELAGVSRGLEVKLRAPTEFATEIVGARSNFGGYLDTAFSDANTESERTFGWGVADASVFRLGETYSVTFDVSGGTGNPSTAYGVELSFQATSDSHYPGLSDPFRMFGDYNYKYLRAVDFKIARFSSQSITAAQNLLYAQSFEEGNQSFDVYSFLDAGNNRAVYCNRLQGYGSDCYLEFNRGTATKASVRQTVPVAVHASDNLTAEARVRCPSGQGSCPITLAIWGLGGERESRSISCTIPASDEWWAIRLDGDNGFEQGFAYDHSAVMWELYNEGDATTNLDVDYTALANGYSVAVRGVNFQPTASSGPACQQADMSNT